MRQKGGRQNVAAWGEADKREASENKTSQHITSQDKTSAAQRIQEIAVQGETGAYRGQNRSQRVPRLSEVSKEGCLGDRYWPGDMNTEIQNIAALLSTAGAHTGGYRLDPSTSGSSEWPGRVEYGQRKPNQQKKGRPGQRGSSQALLARVSQDAHRHHPSKSVTNKKVVLKN